MNNCICGAPVERKLGWVYKYCYNCWWAQDPRNIAVKQQPISLDKDAEHYKTLYQNKSRQLTRFLIAKNEEEKRVVEERDRMKLALQNICTLDCHTSYVSEAIDLAVEALAPKEK